jgi:ArsR family metal-binding transcriptional regulator
MVKVFRMVDNRGFAKRLTCRRPSANYPWETFSKNKLEVDGRSAMLLKGYKTEIFRPEQNPQFESLHCIAHLEKDISDVLPYLNSLLGGFDYLKDPPALILKSRGRLITLHPRKIAINALKDEGEAKKILKWLIAEINSAWERRGEIEPCFKGLPRPGILEILRRLPRTNCRKCNEPTCLVFATRLAEGVKAVPDCSELSEDAERGLEDYLAQFHFED